MKFWDKVASTSGLEIQRLFRKVTLVMEGYFYGERTINKIGKVTGLGRQDSWLLALSISGLLSLCASDVPSCEGVRQVHV